MFPCQLWQLVCHWTRTAGREIKHLDGGLPHQCCFHILLARPRRRQDLMFKRDEVLRMRGYRQGQAGAHGSNAGIHVAEQSRLAGLDCIIAPMRI